MAEKSGDLWHKLASKSNLPAIEFFPFVGGFI